MLTSEQFLKHLRGVLNHLYDPDYLRKSPLAVLFRLTDRPDTPSTLQRILTETIESLKPIAEPHQSQQRRVYQVLLYRYVQQFSQEEIAHQLGLSTRHLRRTQHAALQVLASQLWEHFHLGDKPFEAVEADIEEPPPTASVIPGSDELAWLANAPMEKPADPYEVLAAVTDLAQPLAVRHNVQLEFSPADTLPAVAVHPIALRQIILNLIGVAIDRASAGKVNISAGSRGGEIEIQIGCEAAADDPGHVKNSQASLDMAHQLVSLFKGTLTVSDDPGSFNALLKLPVSKQLTVLAIDDNRDILQLMQRYTSGTRYHLIGSRDPEQALNLVEKFSPQIIVLDVMMPQVDGWELLGRLRRHPRAAHIPIVVCTILAQEELALSLGVNQFIRKPILRENLLSVLDQQAELLERESH